MKLSWAMLSLFVVLALLAGVACAPKGAPQTSTPKEEIVVGVLDDLSGPGAGLCNEYLEGYQNAWRYINEEKGGISGHPLRAIVVDFKMDGTLAVTGWDRLKNEGVLAVLGVQAGIVPVITQAAQEDKLPLLTGGGTFDQHYPTSPSYFFTTSGNWYGVFDGICETVEKDWAKTGEKRLPKLSFDVVSMGNYRKIWPKCAKIAAGKRGWEPPFITYTPPVPADVATQVLQVKNFGCDYLAVIGPDANCIAWLKELDRQNLHPKMYGHAYLGSESVWRAVGPLAVGKRFFQVGAIWTETNLPGIRLLHELDAKWQKESPRSGGSGNYVRGFTNGLMVVEGIKRAIDNVGYEKLDREAVKTALESIKDFDPLQIGSGCTWTETDHSGVHACRFFEWTQDGGQVPVCDWIRYEPIPQEQRTDAFWLAD